MKPVATLLTAALVAAAAGLVALSPKPPAATPAAAAPAKSGAAAYMIDPVHSSAIFKIKHAGASNFYGRFNDVAGSFSLDEGGSLDITIKSDSVDTNNDKRNQHIKSADFFSASEFPTIAFKSKSIKKKSDKTFEVMGDLTFRGVTKPLTVTVEQTGAGKFMGKDVAGIETHFTIKRSDFGNKTMVGPLSDDVDILFAAEGGMK